MIMRHPVRRGLALLPLLALTMLPTSVSAGHNSCEEPPNAPKTTPAQSGPATLRSVPSQVRLTNGQTQDVWLTLNRPASPTPVDVAFLVDSTGSMTAAICGVQRDLSQIAIDLARAGVDVRFGLGIYRDYPFDPWGTPPSGSNPGDFAYKRVRDIGPLNNALLRALHQLEAGGGGDGLESALAALYQSATGTGQDLRPAGSSSGDIPKALQMNFRKDTLRLVVNVTDVDFREPGPKERSSTYGDYPGPAFDAVAGALRARKILQAGIAVGGGRPSLERMAIKTGAVAPGAGVDCDGNGRTDLFAGEPLVCEGRPDDALQPISGSTPPIKMGTAIVSIVKALRDEQQIGLSSTKRWRNLISITPGLSSPVNLKQDVAITYRVQVRCTDPGTDTMTFNATLRGARIASTPLQVVCEPPARTGAGVVRAAPPAPSAQQPAQQPVPQTNPNPNPNTNVNPNANPDPASQVAADPALQGNAAIAPVTQEESALAKALEDSRMEASSRRTPTATEAFILAAAALTAAAGAVHTQHRHIPGFARLRRRR